jgi:hypothetical protein
LRYAATLPLVAASLIASALLSERANAQSPYALDRLFLAQGQGQPVYSVLSFNSETAVENYYGVGTEEATLAQDFFAGYTGTAANMLFTRLPVLSARAHLVGGNVNNLSLAQLQAINGMISITSQGYSYSASINLSGVTGSGTTAFKNAAYIIQTDLNKILPTAAVTTASSIAPKSVAFTGSVNNLLMTVTSAPSGSIQVGSIITGRGMPAGTQITSQVSGTPNGAGVYSLYVPEGHISTETLTETYGVLTVGSASSGTVAIGQQVTGAGVLPLTAIESNLSGSGAGSTWLVNYAQTVASENMTMTGAPLSVVYTPVTGATENSGSFSIQQNGDFLYNSSLVSYATGNAANSLYLAEGTGPIGQQASVNSPGEIVAPNGCPTGASDCISIATYMNDLLTENDMFSTFQTTWEPANYTPPGEQAALGAWVENEDAEGGQYTYLENYSDTTPPIVGSEDPSAKPLFATTGATVPEPSTWAMALLGFAGLGLMARYLPGRSTCPSGRRIDSTGRPSGDVRLSQ